MTTKTKNNTPPPAAMPNTAYASSRKMAFVLLALGIAGAKTPAVCDVVTNSWGALATRYTLWDLSVYGTVLVHLLATVLLNALPFVMQYIPAAQKYRIQQNKRPPSVAEQFHVLGLVLASQLLIQAPMIVSFYQFMVWMDIPWDAASLPSAWAFVWRCLASLLVDDLWEYVLHRALHDKRIYRYIHKVHHTYTSPFGFEAEYAHPLETMILGGGFMVGCFLFCNHLAVAWMWMLLRLVETVDVHSGYDFPWNPMYCLPGHAGARFHDFHHYNFTGNYASAFSFWDKWFGTDQQYAAYNKKVRWARVEEVPKSEKSGADALKQDMTCPKRCVVTGAGGMAGRRLVDMLLERGAEHVVALDVRPVPSVERVRSKGRGKVVYAECDITHRGSLDGLFDDADCVFHLAALVGPFYKHDQYLAVNYHGTMNVIDACRKAAVPVLVDCTSPSTRFNGNEISGLSEQELPYAGDAVMHEYARTKALGEQAVLAANCDELRTCAVMPHQVYGEDDKLFLPALLETASTGRLRIFGDGNNLVSFTHVDNLCHGLILAANKLHEEYVMVPSAAGSTVGLRRRSPRGAASKKQSGSTVAGQAFIVTDGGARNFWEEIDFAVNRCELPSISEKMHLPTGLLYALGYLGVVLTKVTGVFVKLTPFTVCMLTIDRHFCIDKARVELGYSPIRQFDEAWPKVIDAIRKRDFPETF